MYVAPLRLHVAERHGADVASFAIFLATRVVMMTAMMLPAFVPVVLVYAQYTNGQDRGRCWRRSP